MGIKNLMKIIQKYSPNSVQYTQIYNYKNQTLAIDANLMIYKIIFAIRKSGKDIRNNKDKSVTHIHSMLMKLLGFTKYTINAIFVFDGIAPKIKADTLKNRKIFQNYMRNKYYKAVTQDEKKKYYYMKSDVTLEEIEEIMELIEIFGFPIINSLEEADSQLAYLSKNNLVDAVVTDDMDILIFGGKKVLKNFTVTKLKKIQEIDLNTILKDFKVTPNQLIDLGILLGCDYCPTVVGVGTEGSYKLIKEYKSLDNMIKKKVIKLSLDYKKAQNYFKDPPIHKTSKKDIVKKKVDAIKLKVFLKKMGFSAKYIREIKIPITKAIPPSYSQK